MVYMDECIRDAMNKSHLTLPMPRDPDKNQEACERFVRTFNPVMGTAYRVISRLNLVSHQNVTLRFFAGSQELVHLERVHREGAHGALHEEVREQGREDT